MAVPALALERFFLLRQRADNLRAANLAAYHAWELERAEVARLEGIIRQRLPNHDPRVDEDGVGSGYV